MRIRTQLIVALLLLSVVPMSLIVAYNYWSSIQAVRRAVELESAELADDMEARMASVGGEIERRVARLGEPLERLVAQPAAEEDRRQALGELVAELGETATLVDSFEFVPEAPPPPRPEPPMVAPGAAPEAPADASENTESREGDEQVALRVDVSEMLEVVGVDLTDVPAMMVRVEENLGELPEGVDRQLILDSARSGLEAVSALAQSVRLEVEGDEEFKARLEEVRQGVERASRERGVESESRTWVREVRVPVREQGRPVGSIMAKVKGDQLLHRVLLRTRRQQGEIPFALDGEGNLFTLAPEEEEILRAIPVTAATSGAPAVELDPEWVVAVNEDAESGLRFGIARPIGESLAEVRRNAIRNFGFGAGLIGLALLGILPLSRRMSRDLEVVTEGAGRIARGDLDTRVDVRSRNEIGRLASAFNSMVSELDESRRRLLAESQLRRDQEVEQELLRAEFERKSQELEEARRFQLSLLPKDLPEHPDFEIAVSMRTATEVGGDYYDFRLAEDGTLTTVIGDATGHGAKAGTMVTVIKSLFSALRAEETLAEFLGQGAAAVRRMSLGRMAMALALARLEGRHLCLASAGMPPPLLHRASNGKVEEVVLEGMPLGGLQLEYRQEELEVESGDTLLLMSDGLPELPDQEGDPLGYRRVVAAFAEAAPAPPREIIQHLLSVAEAWGGGAAPADDLTFVALRVR